MVLSIILFSVLSIILWGRFGSFDISYIAAVDTPPLLELVHDLFPPLQVLLLDLFLPCLELLVDTFPPCLELVIDLLPPSQFLEHLRDIFTPRPFPELPSDPFIGLGKLKVDSSHTNRNFERNYAVVIQDVPREFGIRVLFKKFLIFCIYSFLIVCRLEFLHDLLVEKHIQLVYPESVRDHYERRDQEQDVKEPSQERQVVDVSKELPRGQNLLISLVEVPVVYHFSVLFSSRDVGICIVCRVVHAIAIISLPLGKVQGCKLQECLIFDPDITVHIFHPVIFVSQHRSGDTDVIVRYDVR